MMQRYLVETDPLRFRLAVAADRLAEACLLQSLRTRARLDDEQRAWAEQQQQRALFLARELLQTDLVATFGVSTLSLLHAAVVDGRKDSDDARALLTYRFPYELRPDRRDRLWVLTLLGADAELAYGMVSGKASPLMTSWSMDTRGEDAVTELWCAIADLATQYGEARRDG